MAKNILTYLKPPTMHHQLHPTDHSTAYHGEVVYVPIRNPAFCLSLYLTGIHFRVDTLQHDGDVLNKKSIVDQSELKK